LRARFLWPVVALLGLPAWADAQVEVLVDVLALSETVETLRVEGLENASELDRDMLGGNGGAAFQAQVNAIYDPARMTETLRAALGEALTPEQREEVIAFFDGPAGARIIALENSARSAILDEGVEAAARARYTALEGTQDARLDMITDLIGTGDMISRNVTAAMNANLQFLRGLSEGDALDMAEAEILSDVMGDMEEITLDTTSWLYGYMLLAYSPLSEEELADYIAFSRRSAGTALNRGLFEGFGRIYTEISYALGRVVALNMAAEEL
tara:strand:+ start:401 stop:1210 length:810 start_codon:yes stop_codon:yes gene_type:complete